MGFSSILSILHIELLKARRKPSLAGLILLPIALLLIFNYSMASGSSLSLKVGVLGAAPALVSSVKEAPGGLTLKQYDGKPVALKALKNKEVVAIMDVSAVDANHLVAYSSQSGPLSDLGVDALYGIFSAQSKTRSSIRFSPVNISKSSSLMLSTWLLFTIIIITTELAVIAIAEDRESKMLDAILTTRTSPSAVVLGKTLFILLVCFSSTTGLFISAYLLGTELTLMLVLKTSLVLALMALGLIGLGLLVSSFFPTVRQVRNASSYVLMIFFLPVALEALLPLQALDFLSVVPSVAGKRLIQSIFADGSLSPLYLLEIAIFSIGIVALASYALRTSFRTAR